MIQDVDIPIEHTVEFLEFLLREIGVLPIWICPFRSYDPSVTYDLYALDPKKLYINFGFWDTVPSTQPEGHYNKKIEAKALALHGKKGTCIPLLTMTRRRSGRSTTGLPMRC